jgi:hypothetical protein
MKNIKFRANGAGARAGAALSYGSVKMMRLLAAPQHRIFIFMFTPTGMIRPGSKTTAFFVIIKAISLGPWYWPFAYCAIRAAGTLYPPHRGQNNILLLMFKIFKNPTGEGFIFSSISNLFSKFFVEKCTVKPPGSI